MRAARLPNPDAPLYRRMADHLPDVVQQVLAGYVSAEPSYRKLPRELLDGDIARAITANIGTFLRVAREQRLPSDQELGDQIAIAVRRAQQGIALETVVGAYHIAAQVGWEAMSRLAKPEESADLLAMAAQLLRYLAATVPTVAAAYLDEQQAIHGEQREAQRALASALLTGDHPEVLAERLGISLTHCHLVLVLRLVQPPAGSGVGMLARGTALRLQQELPFGALTALDNDGGTILLPSGPSKGGTNGAPIDLAGVPELVGRLAVAIGAEMIVGVAESDTRPGIPSAAEQAAEIAGLARRLGRPPGCYRLDDVLLEYQLSRPCPASQRLAQLLEPLLAHHELMRTLRTFIDRGYSRHHTAEQLGIHRNTLNYRLRRIAALTGYSPTDSAHARLLAAALVTCEVTVW